MKPIWKITSTAITDSVGKWGYRLGAVYGILHLVTVILHNIGHLSCEQRYFASLEPVQQQLEPFRQSSWIRYYAQWAGIHGGYGFYSPQVGSSYHSRFTLSDTTSGCEGERSFDTPGLTGIATQIRYRSLLEARDGWFIRKGEVNKLAKALTLSLCRNQAGVYGNRELCCSYMALSTPALRDYKQGKPVRLKYIVLYEHAYKP